MTPFYESRVRFRACIFSLIELAHERIYRVRVNDYPGRYPGIPSVEGLGSPLFVEMLTVREK